MEDELPTRWEIELEFVQSLSNIQYLNYLAQNNYLTNPEFLNYLNYLNYWKQPQYVKYLVYPNCLHILTLLQNEEFRKNIVNPEFMNTVMNDMVKRWSDNDIEAFELPNENATNGNGHAGNENGVSENGVDGNGINGDLNGNVEINGNGNGVKEDNDISMSV
ncbi:mediator of RNA polymerase II transcription subunit 31 [[Candida] jaroonii]|uniref:Mediator of RNA polymerase II transcription subunit 31 n=1 Tax=[Candida] jaroonii TaxID=467808 RepID=A0ACA9YBB4_9ASCO|nr:mediator of RNA polymerase II transcription subunit 31 [[Candida] jaroonii]